jgi:hypothetical protein
LLLSVSQSSCPSNDDYISSEQTNLFSTAKVDVEDIFRDNDGPSAIAAATNLNAMTKVGETSMGLTLDCPISIGLFTTANKTRIDIENN